MRQALELAIYREIGASGLYKTIADTISNPEGKQRFERLSKDEEGHRIKLEKWFEKLFGTAFTMSSEGIKQSEIAGVSLKRHSGALEALDIAIKTEEQANNFYRMQADHADDPDLKALFLALAEEENGHHELLEAERNALIGGFYWFDMDSTSFLED
ncbi:MAG: ferritin family protein [bacterium]|nr:MAG: ferritin family protein [bacterium]